MVGFGQMNAIPPIREQRQASTRRLLVGLLIVFVILLGRTAVASANSLIKELPLPEGLSSAQSMAVDASGRVWFSEKVGKKLAVFDPSSDSFETFSLPSSWGELGFSKITVGPGGDIWFTMHRWVENENDPNMLGRFSPGDGYFTKYALSIDAIPEDIFVADDGVVWFLANNKNSLYRVNPKNFKIKGYAIPTENASPRGLVADDEGNIWFSEANANKIGKFVPKDEVFYEYEVPTDFANPGEIAIDADGRVWFVETTTNRLGVFYPKLDRFDEALIPTARSSPNSLAVDNAGRVWFLEYRANKVGVFNPKTAVFQEYDIPTFTSLPGEMAIDQQRSVLWFTQSSTEAKRLGMIALKEVPVESGGGGALVKDSISAQESLSPDTQRDSVKWLLVIAVIVIAVIVGGWYRHSRNLRNP